MTKGDCKINGSISRKIYRALFLCYCRRVLSKVDNTCTSTYSIIVVTSPSVCGIRTFYGASLTFITIHCGGTSLTYHTCTFLINSLEPKVSIYGRTKRIFFGQNAPEMLTGPFILEYFLSVLKMLYAYPYDVSI